MQVYFQYPQASAGGAVAAPFIVVVDGLPRGPAFPIGLRTHLDPLKLNLQGKDRFFTSPGRGPTYDWPNPRGYIPGIALRTHLDPLKTNLLGQDKFFGAAGEPPKPNDFPNPTLSRDDKRRGWLYNLAQTTLNIVSGGTTTAAAVFKGVMPPLIPYDIANLGSWALRAAKAINGVLRGNIGAAASVTLAVSTTTSTIYDSRILPTTYIALTPQTASAATALLAGIYVVPGIGSAVIHHASNAATDQSFGIAILN